MTATVVREARDDVAERAELGRDRVAAPGHPLGLGLRAGVRPRPALRVGPGLVGVDQRFGQAGVQRGPDVPAVAVGEQ